MLTAENIYSSSLWLHAQPRRNNAICCNLSFVFNDLRWLFAILILVKLFCDHCLTVIFINCQFYYFRLIRPSTGTLIFPQLRQHSNNYKPKIVFRKRTKRRSSKSVEHNSILRKQMLKTKQKTSANSHKSHKWNNVLWIIWKNDNPRIIWIMA